MQIEQVFFRPDAMNLLTARLMGAEAFDAGNGQDACPFPLCSDEQGAWFRGHATARYGATEPVSTPAGTRDHEQKLILGSAE